MGFDSSSESPSPRIRRFEPVSPFDGPHPPPIREDNTLETGDSQSCRSSNPRWDEHNDEMTRTNLPHSLSSKRQPETNCTIPVEASFGRCRLRIFRPHGSESPPTAPATTRRPVPWSRRLRSCASFVFKRCEYSTPKHSTPTPHECKGNLPDT